MLGLPDKPRGPCRSSSQFNGYQANQGVKAVHRPVQRRGRRYPLHLHISMLFALLLVFTGIVLGLFNYRQATQIILSSSQQVFQAAQLDVEQDLKHTYQPIQQLLALLALNPLIASRDTEERLELLPVFAQALHDNPRLASLYVGYADGDFFMVRQLRNPTVRARFEVPEQAVLQVWAIQRSPAGARSEHLYFDARLQLLERRRLPNERYDPRLRPWFDSARSSAGQITTRPYVFFSTEEIGTTLARRSSDQAVLAADLTLADLSATLARHRITASTEVALFDGEGMAVAYPDSQRLVVQQNGVARQTRAADLAPALAALLRQPEAASGSRLLLERRHWIAARSHIAEGGPDGLHLALLVPEDELLVDAYRIRWQGALITLGILLLSLPIGWLCSRVVARPLRALVREAEAIRRFDFAYPISGRSPILELDQLALSMAHMKSALGSFIEISASLSAEQHFESLLDKVVHETLDISEAHAGVLYLVDEASGQLVPRLLVIDDHSLPVEGLSGYALDDPQSPAWLRQACAGTNAISLSVGFEQAGAYQTLLHRLDCPRLRLAACGLHNSRGVTVGALILLQRDLDLDDEHNLLHPERLALCQAISGVAALCIESQRLLLNQKQLLDALIQLIAGAIDAKSPYTGGHCQRVPELTLMLARAAAADEQTFADYRPGSDDWEALHIAAWLHDCGKVTTPEHVVDKSTKLECIHDRIHEIRTRFEVLKRDVWIDYWQTRAAGGEASDLEAERDSALAALDDDFAFVAQCNLGGERMEAEDLQRLARIAQRSWLRTLDDRLGVSWEEAQRLARSPAPELPVREPLLADRPEHLIERLPSERQDSDNRWGFNMPVPAHRFNRGELYNLSVQRGTLTSEERYIINHHMVQTIRMLGHLPLPPHLAQVPEIAGGHHEKMDGSGYPRGLTGSQMSLPARMMAIADIFEALTAADRPYKKAKRLSEALAIMADMCRHAHVDPQLFELFLRAGVYLEYARQFLAPEQIDAVDEEALLDKALGRAG